MALVPHVPADALEAAKLSTAKHALAPPVNLPLEVPDDALGILEVTSVREDEPVRPAHVLHVIVHRIELRAVEEGLARPRFEGRVLVIVLVRFPIRVIFRVAESCVLILAGKRTELVIVLLVLLVLVVLVDVLHEDLLLRVLDDAKLGDVREEVVEELGRRRLGPPLLLLLVVVVLLFLVVVVVVVVAHEQRAHVHASTAAPTAALLAPVDILGSVLVGVAGAVGASREGRPEGDLIFVVVVVVVDPAALLLLPVGLLVDRLVPHPPRQLVVVLGEVIGAVGVVAGLVHGGLLRGFLPADLLVVLLLQLARLLVAGAPATDAEAGDLDLGLRARALLASVRRGRRLRRRWVVVLVVVGGDVSAAPLLVLGALAIDSLRGLRRSLERLRLRLLAAHLLRHALHMLERLRVALALRHGIRPRSSARPPPTAGVAENLRLSRAPTKTRWLGRAERSDQVDGWV